MKPEECAHSGRVFEKIPNSERPGIDGPNGPSAYLFRCKSCGAEAEGEQWGDAIIVYDRRAGRDRVSGPNDTFGVGSNNDPDPPNEDDEVLEPQDYTGDYPLETEGEDDE